MRAAERNAGGSNARRRIFNPRYVQDARFVSEH